MNVIQSKAVLFGECYLVSIAVLFSECYLVSLAVLFGECYLVSMVVLFGECYLVSLTVLFDECYLVSNSGRSVPIVSICLVKNFKKMFSVFFIKTSCRTAPPPPPSPPWSFCSVVQEQWIMISGQFT